jgi:ABC-type nitrate/sulfonate/bicarbonate transport system substrate-binding protein
MKLVIADLISNSYFPVVAAADLGFFAAEGLEVEVERLHPVSDAYQALRDGRVDFVGGSAHAALAAFPEFQGVKLLCAQAQGMYWFFVMRADLGLGRGQLEGIKGRVIAAGAWVDMGLRRLLVAAGFDVVRDAIQIAPVPGADAGTISGLTAAKALEEGKIDGFWANGMAAAVAVRSGAGTIVLDVRRGDGPKPAFHYTFSALATTDRVLAEYPDRAAAAVRAIGKTHAALRSDPDLATTVGERRFPAQQAALIAELIRRDLPYFDTSIPAAAVTGMNRFARDLGILSEEVPYERVVATQLRGLWSG